jgi:transcriptional regulator with XRE-family HTH domain
VKNLGLQAARKKSGKTQAQIAKEAGVSKLTYQRYEYGQNEAGVRTAIRIADALGVTDLRELFAAAPEE